jgi:hypothetical protein
MKRRVEFLLKLDMNTSGMHGPESSKVSSFSSQESLFACTPV